MKVELPLTFEVWHLGFGGKHMFRIMLISSKKVITRKQLKTEVLTVV